MPVPWSFTWTAASPLFRRPCKHLVLRTAQVDHLAVSHNLAVSGAVCRCFVKWEPRRGLLACQHEGMWDRFADQVEAST